jgi:magnesium transporter
LTAARLPCPAGQPGLCHARPGHLPQNPGSLGLFEPGEQELDQVRDTFGLHELAIEDALNSHMRPKIENYDQDVQLVVLRTARYDDDDAAEEVEFGQISVFLALTFVITVRQGMASELSAPGSG